MARVGYAYYIPEGTGYLHIRRLGEGVQGWTSLVQSVADKKMYVRKKTRPGQELVAEAAVGAGIAHSPNFPPRIANREVGIYRPYPLIPTLIDWTDYSPNRQIVRDGLNVESTTMIWQFCNGGDLAHFYDHFDMEHRRVPEQIIWRCFSQLLRTIEFLHRYCRPHIVHSDLGAGNVFINWDADSRFPDFYVGDFGTAATVDLGNSASEDHGDLAGRLTIADANEEITEELHSLGMTIAEMIVMNNDDLTENWPENIQLMQSSNGIYSDALFQCLDRLNDMKWDLAQHPDQYHARLSNLRAIVDAQAVLHETDHPADVSFTKPVYRNAPLIFSSRNRLLASQPAPQGPWSIATVDPNTFDLLSVESRVY